MSAPDQGADHRRAHDRLLVVLGELLPRELVIGLGHLLISLDLYREVTGALVDSPEALSLQEQTAGRRALALYRELLDRVAALDDEQRWTDAEVEAVAGREILDEGAAATPARGLRTRDDEQSVKAAAPDQHQTERWLLSFERLDVGKDLVAVGLGRPALEHLAGLPADVDGHLADGMLWIGGDEYEVDGLPRVHDGDHLGWS